MERVTPNFSLNFACRKCAKNTAEVVKHEEKLCDEVKSKKVYIDRRHGECMWRIFAVIAKTRCGWVKFNECGELLHDKNVSS